MMSESLFTIAEAWDVIHNWMEQHAPTVLKTLNKPAGSKAITQLEAVIGLELPEDFKASYRIHDGADGFSGPIIGVPFLSLAGIANEWKTMNPSPCEREKNMELREPVSFEEGLVKENAQSAKWVPFAGPDEENYIALDFDPGPKGRPGQVINFGLDQAIYGTKRYVLASSFSSFLNFLANQFADDKVEVHHEGDPSHETYLQLKRRRADGASCNLLTGLYMVFGEGK